MILAVYVVLGLLVGHAIRRLTPHLLSMQDTSMPFKLPWVEVVCALAFFAVFHLRGSDPSQWKWLVFAVLLLAITAADHHSKYVPLQVCWLGAGLGLFLGFLFPVDIIELLQQEALVIRLGLPIDMPRLNGGVLALMGGAMGFFQMDFIRRIFRPIAQMDVMGSGDAWIMAMAGTFIGPKAVLFALLPACLLGVVMGLAWKMVFKTPHFPFGPALSMGAFLMPLYGERVIWGLQNFHRLMDAMPAWALLLFSLFLIILLIVLLIRLKNKAAAYEEAIEKDYQAIDEKLKK